MEEFPPSEYSLAQPKREREEKIRDLIDLLGLDSSVVLSGGARGQRGNVRFESNYATTSQSSCVLWARRRPSIQIQTNRTERLSKISSDLVFV